MAHRRGPEEKARTNINSQLEENGWIEIDEPSGTGYIEEYETKSGPVDYALVIEGDIVGVIEAKSKEKNAYAALNQAERYAKDIDCHFELGSENQYSIPFVMATNSKEIHFRDLRERAPKERELRNFHSPEGLKMLLDKDYQKSLNKLDQMPLGDTYEGLWKNQKQAIRGSGDRKGIEPALQEGKRKVLVQMATGTGKTWMAAAQVYRLLKSDLVNRVLFLVDRNNLAKQARNEIRDFDIAEEGSNTLGDIYEVEWAKKGNYPKNADIVISTLQGMYSMLEEHDDKKIEQDDFDLIITDEVHRSIYGEWKVVLSHFDAYEIGLTATPAEHTVSYFDEWVYQYSYWQAVDDGKVVPYETYRIDTEITMEGLHYDGEEYSPSKLEREITVPDRNRKIAKEFRENSDEDEITVVFAINDEHAIELEKAFRKVYSDKSNEYVKKITYTTDNAGDELDKFKKIHRDPTIAITVEMISTGTDIEPLENIVFVRPVKSPILYNQMVGRGTRTYDKIGKEKFTIFDCVGVIEYFQNKKQPPFDQYRPKTETRKTDSGSEEGEDENKEIVKAEEVADEIIDSKYIFRTEDGEEMKPDDYVTAFEKYIRNNKDRLEAIEILDNKPSEITREDLEELSEKLKGQSERFTEEKLRKAYEQEMVDLVEFVRHALGKEEFLTTEERVEKAFEAWEKEHDFTEKQQKWLDLIREHFKKEKRIKRQDFNDIPFIRKGGWNAAAEAFNGEKRLKRTLDELNDEVILA